MSNIVKFILEFIAAVSITNDIFNLMNVIFDAKLNISVPEFVKHRNIRYEIYK